MLYLHRNAQESEGERKTLRLVAQYGDACNLSMRLGKDEVQRKLQERPCMTTRFVRDVTLRMPFRLGSNRNGLRRVTPLSERRKAAGIHVLMTFNT